MAKKTAPQPETHTHADGTVHNGPAHQTHTHADGTVHEGPPHDEASELVMPSTVLSLTVPWNEVEPIYAEVLLQMARRVKAPGFRPGKVPTQVAEGIIGEEKLKDETAQRIMPNAYNKLIKESGKQPISQPEIQATKITMNEDWVFSVSIAEKPEITVKNYQKVVKDAKKAADKELAQEAKTKKDDKKEAKPASAEADPEAAKKDKHLQFIYRDLVTTYKPRVPELLLRQETRSELEEMVRSLDQLQMKLDDYLARRQITFEQLTNEVATQVLGKLQLDLLYGAIIDDQKLTATEADVNQYLERIADEKTREAQAKDERYLSYVRALILRDKVSEHLLSL